MQKGPEIRTGNTKGDADFPISIGTEITITTDDAYLTDSDDKIMYVDYKNITNVIEVHSACLKHLLGTDYSQAWKNDLRR